MASSLQGQKKRNGESTSASALLLDEEDTELLPSRDKALQNDLILGNISGFLPLSDLKECRLVNQQWKGASQASCVKKCKTIGFFGDNGVEFISYGYKMHRIEEMPDLIQLINRSGDAFPCKSFLVECSIRDIVDNPEEETILVNFFRAIAPITETLWIYGIKGRLFNGNPPQNLHFPSLKSLELTEVEFTSSEAHGSNLKFCRNIIQSSPQLEKLDIGFENSEIANKLITALKTVQGHNISDLDLSGPLNDTLLNLVTGIGLKLRGLSLWFNEESILPEDGESLRNFLSNQSNSLEVLHLRSTHVEEEQRITFPVMKKLTQLQFEIWSNSGIGISRISYAEQFPALRSLSIVSIPQRDLDSLFDFRIGPVNTVTSLELPEDLDNPALIWQAARIFPKVRKLAVPSRERILKSVYEAWQKVEDLTIEWTCYGDSADKVLTTYTRSNHGLAQGPLDEKDFQPVEFLHNLKVLKLEHGRELAITDNVCRLVLLKLRSLRRLELTEESSEEISKEVLQEMRDKFSVIIKIE